MRFLIVLLLFAHGSANSATAPNGTSSDIAAKESFENALISLRNQTVRIIPWTDALEPALLANSLSVIAASTIDSSLENDRTVGTIRLLTTPRSFRASVFQTVQSISNSFRMADQSMTAMKINLNDVPRMIKAMIKAYAKPEDKGSKFLMKIQMKTFARILKSCVDESSKVSHSFNSSLDLIRELAEATSATVGDNKQKVKEARKNRKQLDKDRQLRDKQNQQLAEDIKKQQNVIEDARKKHNDAVHNATTNSKTNVLNLAVQVTKAVVSGTKLDLDIPKVSSDDADITGSQYIKEMEVLDDLKAQEAANREELANIGAKIGNAEEDLLDSEDLVLYLPQGAKLLYKIATQWSQLRTEFETMNNEVEPIKKKMETAAVDMATNASGTEESRGQLILEAFEAAARCVNIASEANIYSALSKKFLLPLIDASTSQLALNKEDAQIEFRRSEARQKQVKGDAMQFIEEKLLEADKKAMDQLKKYRDEFNAAMQTKSNAAKNVLPSS